MTVLTTNLILQKTKVDNLRHVKKLNCCGTHLTDIQVLRNVPTLEVCSLSANSLEDLEPLAHCTCLKELYLRRNNLKDMGQILYLSHLHALVNLGMSENPVSSDPSYRQFVIAAIPSLKRLDDVDVSGDERNSAETAFPDVLEMLPSIVASASSGAGGSPPQGGSGAGATGADQVQVSAGELIHGGGGSGSNSGSDDAAGPLGTSSFVGGGTPNKSFSSRPQTSISPPSSGEKAPSSSSPLAQTAKASGAMNLSFGSASEPPNVYNGDDVPVGGARPRPRPATLVRKSSAPVLSAKQHAAAQHPPSHPSVASSVEGTGAQQQVRRASPIHPHVHSMVGGGASSSSANGSFSKSTVVKPSSTHHIDVNDNVSYHVGATAATQSVVKRTHNNPRSSKVLSQQQNPQEEAMLTAVKSLLNGMSPASLMQVQGYLDAIMQ